MYVYKNDNAVNINVHIVSVCRLYALCTVCMYVCTVCIYVLYVCMYVRTCLLEAHRDSVFLQFLFRRDFSFRVFHVSTIIAIIVFRLSMYVCMYVCVCIYVYVCMPTPMMCF